MIKIISGFREDQSHSVPDDEAHKAYYLFLTPGSRAVFSNGLALRHEDVQRIEPDFRGTMGWNAAHRLDADDMNEVNNSSACRALKDVMSRAADVARSARDNQSLLSLPLNAALEKVGIRTGVDNLLASKTSRA